MRKLSASALNTFLQSPRKFYWSYVKRLAPVSLSVGSFDHDKILGTLWSEIVDRFYKGSPEQENTSKFLEAWQEQTIGWVPDKTRDKLTEAAMSWINTYYQMYDPKDGIRNGSEKFVENDRFLGYLDGLSHDLILHECKSTSRAKSVSEQLQKVQSSIQVKLYCVMAEAIGVRIEFAYKDPPYGIYRSEVMPVTPEQRKEWEQQLNVLADYIYSLGEDENNYLCAADSCSIITKNWTSVCEFQPLCLGIEGAEIAFQPRINTRVVDPST